MSQRIAVYGGSFDPFHTGHLVPTVRAQETFQFDAVYFVPAGFPPHKDAAPLTPVTHRLAMVAMATLPYENFFVSDAEVFADGPTYSVQTVHRFRERYPDATLYFILGSDSFSQIASWERWEELVDAVHLVVLHRAHMWGDELVARVPQRLHPQMREVEVFARVELAVDISVFLVINNQDSLGDIKGPAVVPGEIIHIGWIADNQDLDPFIKHAFFGIGRFGGRSWFFGCFGFGGRSGFF